MQRYCKRGHDTDVFGRVQRMCRECRRLSDRRRYARSRDKRLAQQSRYYLVKGYLKRLNRMADSALQKVEVLLGIR
jgi:hypothetical protein